MNLMQYNPFREMDSLFNRLRHDYDSDYNLQNFTRSDWVPAVDINESDKEFLITVEVPQINKDDIKIEVQNGMLNISGERKYENEDKKAHRIERYYGSFQRSFKLPDNVKEDKIYADHKNGVLYVNLPKSEEKLPAKLDIKVH
ncbi:MAG: Hsp20/alpha crystallin family protein [Lysobacterales bacterium]